MLRRVERSLEELYKDDPERADALVFGRRTGVEPPRLPERGRARRRWAPRSARAIPFAANHAGRASFPAAHWRKAPPPPRAGARRRRRPAAPGIPRQGQGPRRARRQAAGRRDARAPARRRDDADRQVLHPQQRPDPGGGGGPRGLEAVVDGEVEQAARAHARRAQAALPAARPTAWCWNAAATAARSSSRRRAATSGPTAAPAAPNGPACRSPMCSRPRA